VGASEGMAQSVWALQLEIFSSNFQIGSYIHKRPLVLMPPKRRKTTHFIDDIYERVSSGLYFLHDDIDNVLLMEDGAPMHCTHISQQWRQAHGIRMLQ
jgi:hypothetical protein